MSIKGFSVSGVTDRYDYNYLDNKPEIHSIPTGGTAGQVLAKRSGADYAVEWADQTGGCDITVDDVLSNTSENPVQNKVITAALATKADQAGIQQVIEDEVDDWLSVQAPSIGTLSYAAKQALLACFAHVAWIDDQGQSYYNALESELFPDATLESISAVFTQGSAVIYDTDSLDTLTQYLTVTATYADSTTATVSDYTLSGTLTAGTSTITVSYGGKTTTFTVNVTGTVKLANGTHMFSDNSVVTVNNNHVTIYLATLVAGSSRFVNLSDLDGNTNSIFSDSNVNNKTTTFISLSANDTATLDVFNASSDNATWAPNTHYYDVAINARKYNETASAFSPTVTVYPANSTPNHEKITEGSTSLTASSSITMSCLIAYIASGYPAGTTVEFDVRVVA